MPVWPMPVNNPLDAILPDLIPSGLDVVFCGTAAGTHSALQGSYYAGRGNRFWRTLHETGMTDRQLRPDEWRKLRDFGIGLTDIAKAHSGMDRDLPREAFDVGRFTTVLETASPKFVAFNGKAAAKIFLGASCDYGLHASVVGMTEIFVLPSTSGAANGHWDFSYWQDLADIVRSSRSEVRLP